MPVEAMLSMKYLWKNAYAIMTVSESNVAAARSEPSCDSDSPPIVKMVTICGIVMSDRSRTTIKGQSTSFQFVMNVNSATVMTTGRERGQITWKRIRSS